MFCCIKLINCHCQDENVVEAEATRRSSRQVVTARNREDANLNFPPGTPVVKIMEDTLRDIILDLEEKIHMGGLGSLKVLLIWPNFKHNKIFNCNLSISLEFINMCSVL